MSVAALMASTGGAAAPVSTTKNLVVASLNATPFIRVWPFDSTAGTPWGNRWSDPTQLPLAGINIDYGKSAAEYSIAMAVGSSPFQSGYTVTPPTNPTSFLTRLNNTQTIGNYGSVVKFSPSFKTVFSAVNGTPFVAAWPWSPGYGTKYANPDITGLATSVALAVSPDGTVVVVGMNVSPWIAAWKWNDVTGWGARYANLNIGLAATTGIAFSPSGKYFLISVGNTGSSLRAAAYNWSNDTGFGSLAYSAATPPPAYSGQIAFSPNGKTVAFGLNSSPNLCVYPWDDATGFGTEYTRIAATGGVGVVGWSGDGSQIITSRSSTPFIISFPFTEGVGMGTVNTTAVGGSGITGLAVIQNIP